MRFAAAALAAVSLLAAGCGDSEAIRRGGIINGTTLTVYAVLPDTPAAADVVDGAKLALFEAGGRAGDFTVNFVALDEGRAGPAESARQAIRDAQIVAAIGAASDEAASVQVPLFNEAGVLLISPAVGPAAFLRDTRYHPAGEPSFARLVQAPDLAEGAERVYLERDSSPAGLAIEAAVEAGDAQVVTDAAAADTVIYAGTDPAQATEVVAQLAAEAPRARVVVPEALAGALADGLPRSVRRRTFAPELVVGAGAPPLGDAFAARFGRPATAHAVVGHSAMSGILAAVADAEDPHSRASVIEAYFGGDRQAPAVRHALRRI